MGEHAMASTPMHSEWQVVLRNTSGHVVLYNSISNEVSAVSPPAFEADEKHFTDPPFLDSDDDIRNAGPVAGPSSGRLCPLCKQPAPIPPFPKASRTSVPVMRPPAKTIADGQYFRLLSRASTPQASRPSTPPPLGHNTVSSFSTARKRRTSPTGRPRQPSRVLDGDKRADGYYARFFVEERKLGRGQRGSVYLCRHVLDTTSLGYYAIKKIPVGESSPQLLAVLQEVKHLELLHHPNVISYKHSWLESTSLGPHQPTVPVLFVLMDFANGGSLDSYIKARQGLASGTNTPRTTGEDDDDARRRARQKTLFRQRREEARSPTTTARVVHLLNIDEILSIFEDTCRGLAFLHSKGILHRDLKGENVLLTWLDGDAIIPTAALADFGSSIGLADNWDRQRTGRTGTLDWVPPEALRVDPRTGRLFEVTKKGDIWQLGLILHLLCFFCLPYKESDDIDRLISEIRAYRGFGIPDLTVLDPSSPCHRLDLPLHLLELLASMLTVEPAARPSCDTILIAIETIRREPVSEVKHHALVKKTSLTPPLDDHLASPPDDQDDHTERMSTSSAIVPRSKVEPPILPGAEPGTITSRAGGVWRLQIVIGVFVILKSLLLSLIAKSASRHLLPPLTCLIVLELLVADIRISALVTGLETFAFLACSR